MYSTCPFSVLIRVLCVYVQSTSASCLDALDNHIVNGSCYISAWVWGTVY